MFDALARQGVGKAHVSILRALYKATVARAHWRGAVGAPMAWGDWLPPAAGARGVGRRRAGQIPHMVSIPSGSAVRLPAPPSFRRQRAAGVSGGGSDAWTTCEAHGIHAIGQQQRGSEQDASQLLSATGHRDCESSSRQSRNSVAQCSEGDGDEAEVRGHDNHRGDIGRRTK